MSQRRFSTSGRGTVGSPPIGSGNSVVTTVRAQFVAGTAAVITATAITVGGAVSVSDLRSAHDHAPALADVQLAVFANPLLEIYDTIQRANLYLFSIAEPPVTQFDRAGIIPDFLAAGFPIATQYFLNAPDYVSQAVNYLFAEFEQAVAPARSVYPGALRLLTWAVDALPANLFYAAQQLLAGNLVGTLQTLQFATLNPVQAALYQTLNAGLYALGGVGVRAAAVITAVAEWVPTTIRNLVDDVTVVLNAAANVVGNVAFGIQTLNLETVWNSLVVGLLGSVTDPATPTIPDALINQTIGEGGRIYTTPGQPGYLEVPSIRQNLTELRDNIADALATDVPLPEDPPFPVTFLPYASQIPTPWNQTPGPAPVAPLAASLPTTEATVAGITEPAAAVDPPSVVADEVAPRAVRAARPGRAAETGTSVPSGKRNAGVRSASRVGPQM